MKSLPDVVSRSRLSVVREFVLLQGGLDDLDAKGRNGLHRAARLGKSDVAEFLISAGLEVNSTDKYGETPLQMAARRGHLACAEMLLRCGADLNHLPLAAETCYSETPLCSAVRYHHHDLVSMLLSAGADCNLVSTSRRYPLLAAVSEQDYRGTKLLLDAGADLEVQDVSMRKALHIACEVGSLSLCELLIERESSLNSIDHNGQTALHIAAEFNHVEIVRLLISHGADLKISADDFVGTALDVAEAYGHSEISELLAAGGAPRIETAHSLDERWEEVVPTAPERAALEIVAQFKLEPLTFLAQDWQCSFSHMRILEVLETPYDLQRIGYFARGLRSCGGRVDDGLEFLGESYQDYIDRLIMEGYLRELSTAETSARVLKVSELIKIAKHLGINHRGTKQLLFDRIVLASGTAELSSMLGERRLYVRTERGSDVLRSRALNIAALEDSLKQQTVAALESNDLKAALFCVLRFNTFKWGVWDRTRSGVREWEIQRAAKVMASNNNLFAEADVKRFNEIKVAFVMELMWENEKFSDWVQGPVRMRNSSVPTTEVLTEVLIHGEGLGDPQEPAEALLFGVSAKPKIPDSQGTRWFGIRGNKITRPELDSPEVWDQLLLFGSYEAASDFVDKINSTVDSKWLADVCIVDKTDHSITTNGKSH